MPQTEKSASSGRFAGRSHPAATAGKSVDRAEELSELGDLDPALFDLFEQITRWLEAGDQVDEEQLAAAHPAWAREIRSLLPTLRGMARAGTLVTAESTSPIADDRETGGRRTLGDFRIIREIGRGGAGIVYEAEQSPLGRRVALKVLPSTAALDPRAIQRFQLEAQVAGLLQHPRIVPIYAVGLVDNVPYFAMQFIEGSSLSGLIAQIRGLGETSSGHATDHSAVESPSALALGLLSGRFGPPSHEGAADRHSTSVVAVADRPSIKALPSIRGTSYLRTVVRLGIQAAVALGYAHDQGIIHRDIKPANLLLDGRGELWVADFGMADVQGDAGLTLSGDLPGTLRYMSPEQATGQRALVDRRTDIYSLGATLYEALTLQPAVPGSDKVEIIRRIADDEPVPIRRLNGAVPIDLATIVTKALSKDPSSRYQTALMLADDLERFLDGRPIAARPAGPIARSWRWCRRKPRQASLVAALVVALVGGVAGIAWSWSEAVRQKGLLVIAQGRAESSEKKALAEAAKAHAVNHFLIDKLLRRAAPGNNPANKRLTLLEALDRAAAEVGTSFGGQPEIEAVIRLALGQTYHDLGDYTKSEAHYRAAWEIYEQRSNETGEERLTAMAELGHILDHLGRLPEAEPFLTQAMDETRRLLGPSHKLHLSAAGYLADLRKHQDRIGDAEALYRQIVDQSRAVHGPKSLSTIEAINNLGTALQKEAKYEEAERLFRECAALSREVLGARHTGTITSLHNLGFVLNELGRVEEAEKLLRQSFEMSVQVMGPEHPETLLLMSTLGSVLSKLGRLDEAEELLRPCLLAQQRVIGPDQPHTRYTARYLDTLLERRARQAQLAPLTATPEVFKKQSAGSSPASPNR